MTVLVDFHCHLDLFSDYEKVIAETEAARIYTLAVTTTPRAWSRNNDLTKHLKYVRPALGLHPQLVGQDTESELELWKKFLPEAKYIGEVGIDGGSAYKLTLDKQKEVFKEILLQCANQGNKILSVHAVNSAQLVLDLIETHLPLDRGGVVLHWFTGSNAQAERAVRIGCYFSINTAMIRTKKGQSLILSLPYDRILLETDGPFTQNNGVPSAPKDILHSVELLGKLLGLSEDSLKAMVLNNLKTLLTKYHSISVI